METEYKIVKRRTRLGKKVLLQRGLTGPDLYGKERWYTEYEEEFSSVEQAMRRVLQSPKFWGISPMKNELQTFR